VTHKQVYKSFVILVITVLFQMQSFPMRNDDFSVDNLLYALKQRDKDSRSNLISMTAATLIYRAQQKRIKDRKEKPISENTQELKTKVHSIYKKLKKKKEEQNVHGIADASADMEDAIQKRENHKIVSIVTGYLSKNPDMSNEDLIEKTFEDLRRSLSTEHNDDLRQREKIASIVQMLIGDLTQSSSITSPQKQKTDKEKPNQNSASVFRESKQQPKSLEANVNKRKLSEILASIKTLETEEKKDEKTDMRISDQHEIKKSKSKKKFKDRTSAPEHSRADSKTRQSIFMKIKQIISGKSSNVTFETDTSNTRLPAESPKNPLSLAESVQPRSQSTLSEGRGSISTASSHNRKPSWLAGIKRSNVKSLLNLSEIQNGALNTSQKSGILKKGGKSKLHKVKSLSFRDFQPLHNLGEFY